jgi:Icc-related predicted phosphoesterase
MKFIYVTDLHGDLAKYEKALQLCLDNHASLLHIGADLLPKGYSIQPRQKDFLRKNLPDFFRKAAEKGVKIIGMFGNDDIWSRKPLFRERCGPLLDEQDHEQDGFIFSGYPYVPDYPFSFKWPCKYDRAGWKLKEPYSGYPVDEYGRGFMPILDVDEYFASKGTIWDDLKDRLSSPNLIMAFHTPPSGVGLDVCLGGKRKVGSMSVKRWIRERKPYMVLCGHLHESPWESGKTSAKIGGVTVVQPGQYRSAATIDPNKVETISPESLEKYPDINHKMLRAAVIEAIPGRSPKVIIVDR